MSISLTIEPIAKLIHIEAKAIATIISALSELVDEVAFEVLDKGVIIRALDPGKVALLEIELPPEAFIEYEVKTPVKVGLSVSDVKKVMKNIKKGDKFILAANEEFVELCIEGVPSRRYKFRNLEIASTEVPELQLEFPVKAVILADPLKAALSEVKGIAEAVEFKAENEENLIVAEAEERRVEIKFSKTAGTLIELELSEPAKACYDVSYLEGVTGLARIASNVEVRFGTDMPLNLKFMLAGQGTINYLLAPRVS